MKIYSIGARNFRTLESFSIDFKSNYCAISGKNNSGKSAIIDLIQYFLNDNSEYEFYFGPKKIISINRDKTQWSPEEDMEITLDLRIEKESDAELWYFIQKFINQDISKLDDIIVRLSDRFEKESINHKSCEINNVKLEHLDADEIIKKIKSSPTLVVHNSTNNIKNLFYSNNSYTELASAHFSDDDRKRIARAQMALQRNVKKAAKQHREELEGLLGKMRERYQVELSAIPAGQSDRHPLQIKLTDSSVDVPLSDWGSGTQNRTKILMSLLDAVRMKQAVSGGDGCTPVLLLEEPESFLHPSAQAEFGRILNDLSSELGVQIITTTHSPYMLNQTDPAANYLIDRQIIRGKSRAAQIVNTTGKDWMVPFAENLGIIPEEFSAWKSIFHSKSSKLLLVEGELDKEYFEHIIYEFRNRHGLSKDVEVFSYNGKDSLKNNALLKFVVSRFGKTFITYDLDADNEIKPILEKIGLILDKDFCPVGIPGDGTACIEGLVPSRILAQVHAENTSLVLALGAPDSATRKRAKAQLKRKLLERFRIADLLDTDVEPFAKLLIKIGKAFG